MRTVAPMTEQFQHFVQDLKEGFWGDLCGQARGTVQKFLNQESVRLREEAVDCEPRKQQPTRPGTAPRVGSVNGERCRGGQAQEDCHLLFFHRPRTHQRRTSHPGGDRKAESRCPRDPAEHSHVHASAVVPDRRKVVLVRRQQSPGMLREPVPLDAGAWQPRPVAGAIKFLLPVTLRPSPYQCGLVRCTVIPASGLGLCDARHLRANRVQCGLILSGG